MTDNQLDIIYRDKARKSFHTKFDLYVFDKVLQNNTYGPEPEEFEKFTITDELVHIYITKYWQWYNDTVLKEMVSDMTYSIGTDLPIRDIYYAMRDYKRDYEGRMRDMEDDYMDHFEEVFPFEKFREIFTGPECHYCGLTHDMIDDLIDREQLFKKHISRGWSLEMSRPDPNREYSPDNAVMSCYWCTNAKTDEFSEEEFKQIGLEIAKVWEKRMKNTPKPAPKRRVVEEAPVVETPPAAEIKEETVVELKEESIVEVKDESVTEIKEEPAMDNKDEKDREKPEDTGYEPRVSH
ncbi:MAG: hypothetical protein ABIJ16_02730 [Bacteroidota bacterium]